jgi:hypothetical protein
MGERQLPDLLPKEATMRTVKRYEGGAWAYFYVRRRRVAWVHWDPKGRISWERYFDAAGREHGPEIYRHDNGRISYRVDWRHGQRHGKAQQFDERGKLIVESKFRAGSGLDIWCDVGGVSEVREYKKGELHGIEQWWESPKRVYIEGGWASGKKHGIWREWDGGKLEPTSPHFFVRGREVTREKYSRAREKDPSLPAYRAADDKATRAPSSDVRRCVRVRK